MGLYIYNDDFISIKNGIEEENSIHKQNFRKYQRKYQAMSRKRGEKRLRETQRNMEQHKQQRTINRTDASKKSPSKLRRIARSFFLIQTFELRRSRLR